MNCCGKPMRRVDLVTEWCGNCGTIRSWHSTTAPNMNVCATCRHYGSEQRGVTHRCHRDKNDSIVRFTSPGLWCHMYEREH